MDSPAGLAQMLGDTLVGDMHYSLSVEVGNIAIDDTPPHDQFEFDGFPGYRVELWAGDALLAEDEDTLAPAEGTFETSTSEVEVEAGHPAIGDSLEIRLLNLDAGPGIEVNFDHVRLIATPLECAAPPAQPHIGAHGG